MATVLSLILAGTGPKAKVNTVVQPRKNGAIEKLHVTRVCAVVVEAVWKVLWHASCFLQNFCNLMCF